MNDVARRFHDAWLGMVQPSEGLVVSVSVLVGAQCMAKQDYATQEALLACTAKDAEGRRHVPNLLQLLHDVLGLAADSFDTPETLPKPLRLYVPEGKQELRPSLGLKRRLPLGPPTPEQADLPAAALAGRDYLALVWDVPVEVDLDKAETLTGPWEYPPQAKFDRLLRECRVPIGLLSNGRELRLVYAPHGESTGWLSFRIDDMATVGGRPILDAFVMLLGHARWFGVAEDAQLPAVLEQSRRQQADVTNALARQIFEALEELLAGFSASETRDARQLLRRALEAEDGFVYSGLLTLLLRLVFILYCEDRGLLPVDSKLYSKHYSVLGLYEELERDHGRYPDSMDLRYGAYARLVSLFRAIFLGVSHGELHLPPRRGELFDPNVYPFLEGWGGGSAPLREAEERAEVHLPAISDGTIHRVLKQLIVLGGQRLSYRALDVEQIGSVYEALMGFDVERLDGSGAVRIRLGSKPRAPRVWVQASRLLAVTASRRAAWLVEELAFDKKVAQRIATAVKDAKTTEAALEALAPLSGKRPERAELGALVIQPGPERRRTSSHYTPRSLSEPIVHKTLAPLLRTMGDRPRSEALLNLVICDPAMGSGAFLVAACRYLADHVVAAWTWEAKEETAALKGIGPTPAGGAKTKLELLADAHEDVVNHARRLVAERCLYGVDKNRYAVQLARLSIWLVTMAKNEPFTFVDHALRHGDSLVGLNFDQIRAFHWKAGHKGEQIDTTSVALQQALDEAVAIRQQIQALSADPSAEAARAKARLLADALDATRRARLIADLVVGAFFAHATNKDREHERDRRLDLVQAWLTAGDLAHEEELEAVLKQLQAELYQTQVPFHWMLEFPEVFYLERPDPLNGGNVDGAAMIDGFVGNPPFLGGKRISTDYGDSYSDWLDMLHRTGKGADLSAHFFRRGADLLGAHGAIGLIATNTIGQGDTRQAGLQQLLKSGFRIFSASSDLPWPGEAAVTVSVVHLAKGQANCDGRYELDGRPADAINSRLRPKPERADPSGLAANAGAAFVGSYVLGMGFTLTPSERDELVACDARNAEAIFPYLGGEEVNTNPTQSHDRYVISFGQLDLSEAERWPALIGIVREKVKPERDRVKREAHRRYWWHYADKRPALYAAIAPLSRCLVVPQQFPSVVRLAFKSTDFVFSQKLIVVPLSSHTAFAVLQSAVHNCWATFLGGSMGSANTPVYTPSHCFETFPFPQPDPHSVIDELETLGEDLYTARAKYMVDTEQGLTKTYNALKDPLCTDERILAMRELHEAMDRAVLRAYPKLAGVGSSDSDVVGWSDIVMPPYCLKSDEDRAALQAFEDEVIDRLFVLNADRAKKEAALGRGVKKGGKQKPAKEPARPAKAKATQSARSPKRGKKKPSGQGSLGLG